MPKFYSEKAKINLRKLFSNSLSICEAKLIKKNRNHKQTNKTKHQIQFNGL